MNLSLLSAAEFVAYLSGVILCRDLKAVVFGQYLKPMTFLSGRSRMRIPYAYYIKIDLAVDKRMLNTAIFRHLPDET